MTAPWMHQAACRGLGDIMFPTRGEPTAPAKAVCADCPVRPECREWALANGEKYGVLGGLSERERGRIRRARRRGGVAA